MTPPHTIDAPDLQDRISTAGVPPRLVDVRSPAEYQAGHIPGAVNVPLDALKGSLEQLRRVLQDQHVVLVCRSGQRAGQAQEALRGAGLSVLGSLVVPGLQWGAAFVGAGLSFAALTSTCAMGNLLARMPWNTRGGGTPIADLAAGR